MVGVAVFVRARESVGVRSNVSGVNIPYVGATTIFGFEKCRIFRNGGRFCKQMAQIRSTLVQVFSKMKNRDFSLVFIGFLRGQESHEDAKTRKS